MPHFISRSRFTKTNTKQGEYEIGDYLYGTSLEDSCLLPVRTKDRLNLIRCSKKGDYYLYKPDKQERDSNLAATKEILRLLSSNLDLISHNLNPTNRHARGANSPFLLNLETLSQASDLIKQVDFVEIGFGSGRHILELAARHGDKKILGFELHGPSVRQLISAVDRLGLKNLFVAQVDARLGLQILSQATVEAIFLHFPVPWSKAVHRRVFYGDFLNQSLRVLKEGGRLSIRSDDLDYINDCVQAALDKDGIKLDLAKNNDIGITSKYEQRWKNLEKPIYDLNITKQATLDNQARAITLDEVALPRIQKAQKDILLACRHRRWVRADCFVSLGEVYYSKAEEFGLVRLSLGSFYLPFSTYLVARDGILSYFRSPLGLPSHSNAKNLLSLILNQAIEARGG